MVISDSLKDIEKEFKKIQILNKEQALMIERRDKLIGSILLDAQHSAKGTALENVKRKVETFLKKENRFKSP